jgi:hypothetical protein
VDKLDFGLGHIRSLGAGCCRFGWAETQADSSGAGSSAEDNFAEDNFAEDNFAADSFAAGNWAVVVVGSFVAGNWAVVVVAVGAASWIVAEVAKPAGADRRLGSLVGFGSVRGFADHLQ